MGAEPEERNAFERARIAEWGRTVDEEPRNEGRLIDAIRAARVAGSVELVVASLIAGRHRVLIARAALDALWNLAIDRDLHPPDAQEHGQLHLEHIATIVQLSGVEEVLMTLEVHQTDAKVHEDGYAALAAVARGDEGGYAAAIVAAGGLDALFVSMRVHRQDPSLIYSAVTFIKALALVPGTARHKLVHAGGIEAALYAMALYPGLVVLQGAACWAVWLLMSLDPEKKDSAPPDAAAEPAKAADEDEEDEDDDMLLGGPAAIPQPEPEPEPEREPEPEPGSGALVEAGDGAREVDDARVALLREELETMKMRELRERAVELGVDRTAFDRAKAKGKPAVIELIIEEGEAGADAEGLEIGVMQKWRHHETLAEVVLHLPRAMNVFERFVEAEGMDRVATAVENYPRHMVLRRHAQDIQAGLKRQWGRTEWQWAKSGVLQRLKDVAAAAALEPAE